MVTVVHLLVSKAEVLNPAMIAVPTVAIIGTESFFCNAGWFFLYYYFISSMEGQKHCISAVLLLFAWYSLYIVNIVVFWFLFPFSWKATLFCKKSFFSHSFSSRWLKQTFYRELNALHPSRCIFFVFPISSKKKNKHCQNAPCDALLQGFVNEIQSSILFYLWNCRRR